MMTLLPHTMTCEFSVYELVSEQIINPMRLVVIFEANLITSAPFKFHVPNDSEVIWNLQETASSPPSLNVLIATELAKVR